MGKIVLASALVSALASLVVSVIRALLFKTNDVVS